MRKRMPRTATVPEARDEDVALDRPGAESETAEPVRADEDTSIQGVLALMSILLGAAVILSVFAFR